MNELTLIIAWSVNNAELYVRLAGIPRPWMIVSRPEQIRGVADGTRIVWLGPQDQYPAATRDQIDDMLSGRRFNLVFDDTDRVMGVVRMRDEFMDEARIRFLASRLRATPTRQQADDTFTAALQGDDHAAARVREWAAMMDGNDDQADATVYAMTAIDRARRNGRLPQQMSGFMGDIVRAAADREAERNRAAAQGAAVSGVSEATVREAMDMVINGLHPDDDLVRCPMRPGEADWSMLMESPRARHTPYERAGWVTGPDPGTDAPTAAPVPVSGHYDEPDGWGNVPSIPVEPTGDALYADPYDYASTWLFPGERPVW